MTKLRRTHVETWTAALAALLLPLFGSTPILWGQSPGGTGRGESERPYYRAHDRRPSVPDQPTLSKNRSREAPLNIAFFGPGPEATSADRDLWLAASLALDDVGDQLRSRGQALQLLPIWSEDPWGSGVARLAKTVYEEEVVAILGSVDGDATHLAEQVAAKARVVMLNPSSADQTANLANLPWMFSLLPGEDRQAEVLADELVRRAPRYAVLSLESHDSRILERELFAALAGRHSPPQSHFVVASLGAAREAIASLSDIEALDAFVLIADPLRSAALAGAIRESYAGPIFGSSSLARRPFLEVADSLAGKFFCPYPVSVDRGNATLERLRAHLGVEPDFATVQTYDAVRLLAEAVGGQERESGLDLAKKIWEIAPWQGLAGPVVWDNTGQNSRSVHLAEIDRGCLKIVR